MVYRPPDRWFANRRLPLLLALYVLVSVGLFGGVAAIVIEQRLGEHDERHGRVLQEVERRELERHELAATLTTLRRVLQAKDAQLQRSAADNARLAVALARAGAERMALENERNLARDRARLLDRRARETEGWLETAQRERLNLERERAMLEDRLIEAEAARGLAAGREQALRRRLATTEARLAALEGERESTARWLTAWIDERVGAIEDVLEHAGIEPDRLLAPESTQVAAGRGGPFVPLDPELFRRDGEAMPEPGHGLAAIVAQGMPLADTLAVDLERLQAAERVVKRLPLAAPLEHFRLTSRFGTRVDPLTRRKALHYGLDFAAAAGSKVFATAPGEVARAGRAGSYGIMVEIDHGHGMTTRYAHLSRHLVDVGDRVDLRSPIGVIGSTGRSTGRHLHYEIRLDDQPRDPARFLAAGRQLTSALGSHRRQALESAAAALHGARRPGT